MVPVVFGLKALLIPEVHDEIMLVLPVAMFGISGGLEALAVKASYTEIKQAATVQVACL